ncbi:MAG TPA: arylesterase [Gammaproteobacteria bacterium]|nr:arylesterase [Gammaproteobacteria bacterium]
MSRRILCCLLLLLVTAAAAAPATPPVILVMGDSLSAGYGLHPGEGWVELLRQRLVARGYYYTVVNASVSGETTSGGLTRLPQALEQNRPAVVILELGANDGLRGTPVKVMQDNLGRMIQLSRKAGAKVLLAGILLPPNYGQRFTQEFSAVYTGLAQRYHVSLLPFLLEGVAEQRQLMQADGMHPVATAEPRVLDNVWPKLAPLLGGPAAK